MQTTYLNDVLIVAAYRVFKLWKDIFRIRYILGQW